jgi:tetratricopeptide (TPR) repeat protein
MEADSAFTELSELQPNSTLGYLYAAKSRAQYDSTGAAGVAIPMYKKFVEIALEDPEKNKKELIDAYDYLGQFALHKSNDLVAATQYFQKILELDPNNQRAKDFMDAVRQMNNPTRGKGR